MNNNLPLISIVIPTYNHENFVVETLTSVFAQTYAHYEVIVINDGSPDDTASKLEPYTASGRIKYMEQANAGQGAARNRGIHEARGDFIAFLDDDDLWPSDKLEWQAAEMLNHPEAVLVYGFAETFGHSSNCHYPKTKGPCGWVQKDFLQFNWVLSPGQALIRTSALRAAGGFDPTVWGADDWDLWIRLAATGPFLYVSRPALYYRQHPKNASKDLFRLYQNSVNVLCKHLGRLPNGSHYLDWLASWRFILGFTRDNALSSLRESLSKQDMSKVFQMLILVLTFGFLNMGSRVLLKLCSGLSKP
jgi:glycosyltransferase involved in cell wall biosynthesis